MKIERQGSSEQERSDCLDVSYEFPDESSRCAPVLNSDRRNFHSRRRIGDSLLTVSRFRDERTIIHRLRRLHRLSCEREIRTQPF